MGPKRAPQLVIALAAAAVVALSAGGCASKNVSPPAASADTVPAPPSPCTRQPQGVAQDGVNDEQGGSTPGIDPCDGPGN